MLICARKPKQLYMNPTESDDDKQALLDRHLLSLIFSKGLRPKDKDNGKRETDLVQTQVPFRVLLKVKLARSKLAKVLEIKPEDIKEYISTLSVRFEKYDKGEASCCENNEGLIYAFFREDDGFDPEGGELSLEGYLRMVVFKRWKGVYLARIATAIKRFQEIRRNKEEKAKREVELKKKKTKKKKKRKKKEAH